MKFPDGFSLPLILLPSALPDLTCGRFRLHFCPWKSTWFLHLFNMKATFPWSFLSLTKKYIHIWGKLELLEVWRLRQTGQMRDRWTDRQFVPKTAVKRIPLNGGSEDQSSFYLGINRKAPEILFCYEMSSYIYCVKTNRCTEYIAIVVSMHEFYCNPTEILI